MANVWTTDVEGVRLGDNLEGFTIEGRDGKVGKVDHVNYAGTCLTAALGGLLKKERHVIPAGAVKEIDFDTETVYVTVTRDEVGASPNYDPHSGVDENCEAKVEEYYTQLLARR